MVWAAGLALSLLQRFFHRAQISPFSVTRYLWVRELAALWDSEAGA
jgi:hypothetical protein